MAVYKTERYTSIFDCECFRSLYDQSFPEFEKGTWDWRFAFRQYFTPKEQLELETDYEEKYLKFLEFCEAPLVRIPDDTYCFVVYKDDVPVHFTLLIRDQLKPERARVMISLNGRDADNSKSWLYDYDFKIFNMRNARDIIGITEHIIECIKGTPLYNHYAQISGDNALGIYTVEFEEDSTMWFDEAVEIGNIVFKYPTVEEIPPAEVSPWKV